MSLQGQADAHVLRQRTGMKTIVGEKANIISAQTSTVLHHVTSCYIMLHHYTATLPHSEQKSGLGQIHTAGAEA